MENKKKENVNYFYGNLEKFLQNSKLKHKFVVIVDKEIKGSFDTFSNALEYAASNFSPSEFVVQQVIGPDEQIGFLKSAT